MEQGGHADEEVKGDFNGNALYAQYLIHRTHYLLHADRPMRHIPKGQLLPKPHRKETQQEAHHSTQ